MLLFWIISIYLLEILVEKCWFTAQSASIYMLAVLLFLGSLIPVELAGVPYRRNSVIHFDIMLSTLRIYSLHIVESEAL
jgi:hypothetical protein